MFSQGDYLILSLCIMLLWEYLSPREITSKSGFRWQGNFLLYFINLAINWLFLAQIFLVITTNHLFSLLTIIDAQNSPLITALALLFSVLILDGYSYFYHRFGHKYSLLWRLHLVHHSDVEMDVTTNFRHHPLEQIVAVLLFSIFIVVTGIPAEAVALYAGLNAFAQVWHHSNVKIPDKIESFLGLVIITPKIHKLHHSAKRQETDSNFGSVFSLWDRLFGTFRAGGSGLQGFKYGLEYYRSEESHSFKGIFLQPFFNYRSHK